MNFFKKYTNLIDAEIKKIDFPKTPKNLYDPCRYIFELGGKRIRPVLTLLAHELFDINYARAIPAALAVETFHNFSLLHDDIMDKAPLRRGRPTVHTKWNEAIGILSGDVMLVHCYKLLTDNYVGDELSALLRLFNQTAAGVCDGQQIDMDFEAREIVAMDEYIEMISLKTSVLLGCAMKMGAITAGANEVDAELAYNFGKNIGIAFQFIDDYLDAYGSTHHTGKQMGGDIIAGKKTVLVIKCLERASNDDAKLLVNLLNKKSSQSINQVIDLFNKYDVENQTQCLIKSFSEKALQHLDKISIENTKKMNLIELSNFLIKRNY